MCFHGPFRDRQSKADSLGFAGNEWLEQPVGDRRRWSRTRVANCNRDIPFRFHQVYLNLATWPRCFNRVTQQVQQKIRQLAAIPINHHFLLFARYSQLATCHSFPNQINSRVLALGS